MTGCPAPALLLAPLLLAAPLSSQETPALEERARRLEEQMDGLLERAHVPGIGMALANRSGVVWEKGFGVRRMGEEAAVDTDTVFEAASLSKVVFAYLVLQLVDQEVIELDVPLAEYAPYPDLEHDPRYEEITARMALSHTGGLPNWRRRGGRLEFQYPPGERFRYSGEGFVFLQRTIEALTGATLQEIAQDLVFEPLGLERTSFVFEERLAANRAAPHDDQAQGRDPNRVTQGNAAYSLLTTAGDYARFLSALLRAENLEAERLEELLTPQVEVRPGVHWGCGTGLETYPGGRAFWHWGHNGGYRAYFVADPDKDEIFVYFANGDGGMLFLPDVARIATARDVSPSQEHLNYATLQDKAVEERIGTYLEAWERRGELSGVVAVVRRERLLFQKAYGLANHADKTANTPETRFHIASLTKTFTAGAVLLLAEAGELSLSDPVQRFLPDYPRGADITIEHCLAHSAGIPDHHGLPGFKEKTRDGITLAELCQWQSTFPLEFEPGSEHRYTNSGYALLARIVEIVSDQPFDDFLREQLFEPLDMNSTGHVRADAPPQERALGYLAGPPPAHVRPTPDRNWDYARGSGSLESTAGDLLRWSQAVAARQPVDFTKTSWPYGWGKESYGTRESMEQTGLHSGFIATLSVLAEEDLHVVHLQNLQLGLPFQRIHRDVVRLILERPYETPAAHPSHGPDPARLNAFAGSFTAELQGREQEITLETEGPALYWRWAGAIETHYLRPLAPGRFLHTADGSEIRFDGESRISPATFTLHLPWSPEGPHPVFQRQRSESD